MQAGDEGTCLQTRNRPCFSWRGSWCHAHTVVVGNPVCRRHEETVIDMIQHFDFIQVLDPICAEIPGYDQFNRITVQERNIGAVHGPGDDRLAAEGVIDIERLDEIRRGRQHWLIEAVETHLFGVGQHTGMFQHGLQRHTDPASIPHGAVAKLGAEHTRRRKGAAVAGALVDRHHFDCRCNRLQFGQRQRQFARDAAADLQTIGACINRGGDIGQVVAHEKCIVRSKRPFVEYTERRFKMRRTRRDPHQWAFLRIGDQVSLAVVHRYAGGGRKAVQWRQRQRTCS